MLNFKNKFKADRSDESLKYTSNSILRMLPDLDDKLIAFTSSANECSYYDTLKKVFEILKLKEDKICVIYSYINSGEPNLREVDCGHFVAENLKSGEFKKLVDECKKKFDKIFVVVPTVIVYADALEYAKICANVILVEKYMRSKYSEYENTLDVLKNFGINICGVIARK